ncbi:glycine betaine transporter 1 [Nematostella vectensis]|uniref:glycine betaine transporter 1 n=1 Tax=Nematostella vectensis TaxID=45351 RepID=UPI0020770E4A|nr:glycine betaine transporter 1 [Nematostella vectensis]
MATMEEHEIAEAHADKCRTLKFSIGPLKVNMNPVVSVVSAIVIWGLVGFCLIKADVAAEEMPKWTNWVTATWTWLYIGTQNVCGVFIAVLFFSKYSKLKLGRDNEKPEFNDVSYFMMLFAAGIGVGLFYFGVAEPIYHYEPGSQWGNRYQGRYSDNQRARDAINMTLFHWGVHGWIAYTLVGLFLAFLAHRKRMPMTIRSCFYQFFGDHIYGTLGDLIDILSVVCTMFGVCTSLGIGVIQLNTGFKRMNPNIEENRTNQIIIIWGITAVATASVVSGVKLGIRRLSEICFCLGMLMFFVVFFHGDTWYFLNVFVQSIGYYLQTFIQLGFHTDAFAQAGNAPDEKQAPDWMNSWTIFYWGWWIAWSPFVGIFIAKISRGRTIREFISYTLTIPVFYCIMWFSIMGGAGLKMERDAAIAGIQCNSTLGGAISTAPQDGLYRLSCRPFTSMWFDLMEQFDGIAPFLSGLSLVCLILYFVTSSDSGSLVIDSLSANGHPDPPIPQRVFWAVTEGATATALLWIGGIKALKALQAAAMCSGLLYTVVLNSFCVLFWRVLKIECGDMDPNGPQFSLELLDPVFHPSIGRLYKLLIAIVAPWWPMGNANAKLNHTTRWTRMVFMAMPFYAWVFLTALQPIEKGLAYLGWALFMGFVAFATGLRAEMRDKYGIVGNLLEDMFAVLLMYPLVAMQMSDHMTCTKELPNHLKPDAGETEMMMNPKDKEIHA